MQDECVWASWVRGIGLLIVATALPAAAQGEGGDGSGGESAEAGDPEYVETITVTGSRLGTGDPTANIISVDAAEIARRGVSTVEELIRTMPFVFSSLNSQSNMLFGGGASDTDKNLGALGLGTSTVNLRALGSANTVVLLNGRRIAGAAGDEDGFANISHIPLGAIERVDVQLDGGSATYGSDTIGGVVNFITKKNYQGLEATYRNEDSASDADYEWLNLLGGSFWHGGGVFGPGYVTASFSQGERDPIINRKAGFTTKDFTSQFGPEFDLRTADINQPGIVRDQCGSGRWASACGPRRQLPDGHDGTSTNPEDFGAARVFDYIPPQNGSESERQSLHVNFEQDAFDGKLRLFADALYSNAEEYQEFQTLISNVTVPASNAFNPYGTDLKVGYWPGNEIARLGLPPSYTSAETEHLTVNYGGMWVFNDHIRLHLTRTSSASDKEATQVRFDSPSFLGTNNPIKALFEELLASSDPAVALNFFGDGTVQSPRFEELATHALGPSVDKTELTKWEYKVEGDFEFLLPNAIHYAVGGERSARTITSQSYQYVEGGSLGVTYSEANRVGVEEPTNEQDAWFVEVGVPVFENREWAHKLLVNLQVRKDTYTLEGAAGFEVTDECFGFSPPASCLDIVTVESGDTTYRVGLLYAPVPSLELRLSRQDSYRTPTFGDLFSTRNPSQFDSFYEDPYAPGGPTFQRIPTEFVSANLDLNPETSVNWTASATWAPEAVAGLRLKATWSEVDFADQITYGSTLLYEHAEVAFGIPELVQRDEEGNAIKVRNASINIAEKVSEIMRFEVTYRFDTRIGEFFTDLELNQTREEYFRVTPESAQVDRVGTSGGTDEWNFTGRLSYVRDRITTNVDARYRPAYDNTNTGFCLEVVGRCERLYADRPSLEVNGGFVVNANIAYAFDMGVRVKLGGRNIFEETFPTVYGGTGYGYDPTRYDARGRVIYLELQYKRGDD